VEVGGRGWEGGWGVRQSWEEERMG
jgi:hypothetical protein